MRSREHASGGEVTTCFRHFGHYCARNNAKMPHQPQLQAAPKGANQPTAHLQHQHEGRLRCFYGMAQPRSLRLPSLQLNCCKRFCRGSCCCCFPCAAYTGSLNRERAKRRSPPAAAAAALVAEPRPAAAAATALMAESWRAAAAATALVVQVCGVGVHMMRWQ